jgi:hypothetical protein
MAVILLGASPCIAEMNLFAVKKDLTVIWLVNTSDYFAECGFSGAVLPQQCVDFARLQREGNLVQNLHT